MSPAYEAWLDEVTAGLRDGDPVVVVAPHWHVAEHRAAGKLCLDHLSGRFPRSRICITTACGAVGCGRVPA